MSKGKKLEALDKPLKKGQSLWNEFMEFVSRGNVMGLAIGVIMGTTFGKITSTLVGNVIMPLIGLLIDTEDFAQMTVTLTSVTGKQNTLEYGLFLQAIIDFLITAVAIFLFVKLCSSIKKKMERKKVEEEVVEEEETPPEPTREEVLLSEIRDLLKEQNQR